MSNKTSEILAEILQDALSKVERLESKVNELEHKVKYVEKRRAELSGDNISLQAAVDQLEGEKAGAVN